MESVVFPNYDNAFLLIPSLRNQYVKEDFKRISNEYKKRPYHESLFRSISTFTIKNKIIEGNIIDLVYG